MPTNLGLFFFARLRLWEGSTLRKMVDEGRTVVGTQTVFIDQLSMELGTVTFVEVKAVTSVCLVKLFHQFVTTDLGND